MSVCLVMVVANEGPLVERATNSVQGLVDELVIVNTGEEPVAGAIERPWVNFGHNRTEALQLAKDRTDWLLMIDADMTVETHPRFREWLDTDPDPDVDAWQVEIREADITYRLPLLTRATADLRYEGATHEALVCPGKQRPLTGLTVTHHTDGVSRTEKHERDLELLARGVILGDPRSTYYAAQALRCLGKDEDAAELYERRSVMENTWEEERWHAQYMAARLQRDVEALLKAYDARPWRPEPLEWAARFLRENATHADVLFLESDPRERMGPCQS